MVGGGWGGGLGDVHCVVQFTGCKKCKSKLLDIQARCLVPQALPPVCYRLRVSAACECLDDACVQWCAD